VLSQFSQDEKPMRLVAEQALESGAYVTDINRIRSNFAEWENARIVQGAVPAIFETIDFGAVAFLHIDMNSALPTQAAFEFFWDRLSPGAVVLFDDYAFYGHNHLREVIDKSARARGAEVLSLPTGLGVIVK
jgi:hypothetical protein